MRTIRCLLMVCGLCLTSAWCFAAGPVIEQAAGSHVWLTTITLQPAAGFARIQPENGVAIRRITDVSQINTSLSSSFGAWNGHNNVGLTNGYSRFPCISVDGEYGLAFGTSPLAVLWRTSDFKMLGLVQTATNNTGKLGDLQELKWSGDVTKPHLVGYVSGDRYYRQDVTLNPSFSKIFPTETIWGRFGNSVISTSDGDSDNSGMMIAEKTHATTPDGKDTGAARVLVNGTLLPWSVLQNGINGVDVSPWGRFLKVDNRFFNIHDGSYHSRNEPGHGGWVLGKDGTEWFVNQNSRTDWIEAFNPLTGETLYLMRMGSWAGIHVASDKRGVAAGWALVSTYGGKNSLSNSIFFVELKSQKPGLKHPYYGQTDLDDWNAVNAPVTMVRIAPMTNRYIGGAYFTEGFASLCADGNIYWGGNWWGQDNLELYRAELPADTRAVLGIGGGTQPTPAPTATPGPTPTSTPAPTTTPTPSPTGTPSPGATITIDNRDARVTYVGSWTASSNAGGGGPYLQDYQHDGNAGKGSKSVTCNANLPTAGYWNVYEYHSTSSNRATNIPIQIAAADGARTVTLNEQVNGGSFRLLGRYYFNAGGGKVTYSNAGTEGYVVFDALQFVPEVATTPTPTPTATPAPTSTPTPGVSITIDNRDARVTYVGSWSSSANEGGGGPYLQDYLHDGNATKGSKSVTCNANLPTAGYWNVYEYHSTSTNRATNVPIQIAAADGVRTVTLNEQVNGGSFRLLGRYYFNAGGGKVTYSNAGTEGYVVFDALQFVPDGGTAPTPTPVPSTGVTNPGTLTVGQKVTLRWQPAGGLSTIEVWLFKGPAGEETLKYCAKNGTPNDGSFDWTVPADFPKGTGNRIHLKWGSWSADSTEFEIK